MSDAREKQPESQVLDITGDTFGSYTWEGVIDTWPYSGMKNEDVFARRTIVRLRAGSARHALGIVQSISAAIEKAHDVWQTNVRSVSIVDELPRAAPTAARGRE